MTSAQNGALKPELFWDRCPLGAVMKQSGRLAQSKGHHLTHPGVLRVQETEIIHFASVPPNETSTKLFGKWLLLWNK